MAEISEIIETNIQKHGMDRNALLPILQSIVKEKRHLSEETLVQIAKSLDISSAAVYGTASFYSFLDTAPKGKNIIRVCKTIVCDMSGKDEIMATFEKTLGIKFGETTGDKKFTLLTTNCLGWCANGPAMLINDEVYTDLTPDKVREIIKSYK
jgi:NADH:ubiquinone oxidoreductase subunit E